MHFEQLVQLARASLIANLRRLTFWIFAAVFVAIAAMLYLGTLSFEGMSATGAKLGTNSDFAIAALLGAFSFFLMHFTATMCGDPIALDHRLRLAPILRGTPLKPSTYVLGRFLGGYLSLLAIYAVFVLALIAGQWIPAAHDKLTLPWRLWPYLKHSVWFLLVPTFFVGAVSFAIGSLTRSTRMVYVFASGLLVSWFLILQAMGDAASRKLAYWEPSGMIWLDEAIAKDRGNAWLNEHPIDVDLGFVLNRLALVLIGVGALVLTIRRYPKLDTESEPPPTTRALFTRIWAWLRGAQTTVADRYEVWVGQARVPQVEPAERGLRLWFATLKSSFITELRLLAAERSLWIMVPLVMLFAGATVGRLYGPFSLPLYPVSSEYAARMVNALFLLLAGTTIFYTGEVFHRDDANGVRPILYATPASNGAFLLSKYAAMVAVALAMSGLAAATAMMNQAVRWWMSGASARVELRPYLEIGAHVLLPSILVMCALALVVNVLVRSRYLAYFALLAIGGAYVWWVVIRGERSLLWNPLLVGHWRYSDLTHLESAEPALGWHHAYWGALLVAALALANLLLERTAGAVRRAVTLDALVRRPVPASICVAATLAALYIGRGIFVAQSVRGTKSEMETHALALEDEYFAELEQPRLCYDDVDLDITLRPDARSLDVRGTLVLTNAWPESVRTAYFTIDPLYEIRRFELEGAGPMQRDGEIVKFELAHPLSRGERTTLHLDWSGTPSPGLRRDGGPLSSFLLPSATFLTSLSPEVIPLPGISGDLFLGDEDRRKEHGRGKLALLRDRSHEEFVPSGWGIDSAFQFHARIEAPKPLVVLSGGVQSSVEDLGDRRRFTWNSDGRVPTFAVLAYDYEAQRRGEDQVWYHRDHAYNVGTVLDALEDARRTFSASFLPYPYAQLKIAEFPRLADFAQSFPTLMPYSESIGFLTKFDPKDRFVDATYFVTAHEVAHQWWAYLLHPGASLGSQVLSESLAEYSAMVLIDAKRGERARLIFLRNEEDTYLRGRKADKEVPLAQLENEGPVYWYNKGSLVFYMLERRIGRARVLEGLAHFVERWNRRSNSAQPSFATIRDLLAELQRTHKERDLGWFYDQWFDQVVIPDLVVRSATVRKNATTWTVDFTVENVGTGRAAVSAEAIKGEWDLEKLEGDADFRVSSPLALTIDPGKTINASLSSEFEPTKLIVDRLYECIDFDRTNNSFALPATTSATFKPMANPPATDG
ncbi:MAG: hypothetical protein K8S98_13155 [Planctomycetes bacterium]|nr:hypothetical protein [Planctomycetota bacterium]